MIICAVSGERARGTVLVYWQRAVLANASTMSTWVHIALSDPVFEQHHDRLRDFLSRPQKSSPCHSTHSTQLSIVLQPLSHR